MANLLFVSLIVFGLAACKKPALRVNDNLIPVNECRTFPKETAELTCCLDSVLEDSRCPVDVTCVWEGIAVARFKVKIQNTDHLIMLATTSHPPYKKDTVLAGFNITFVDLKPHRDSRKPLQYGEYAAEVSVTKL